MCASIWYRVWFSSVGRIHTGPLLADEMVPQWYSLIHVIRSWDWHWKRRAGLQKATSELKEEGWKRCRGRGQLLVWTPFRFRSETIRVFGCSSTTGSGIVSPLVTAHAKAKVSLCDGPHSSVLTQVSAWSSRYLLWFRWGHCWLPFAYYYGVGH